MTHFLIEQPAIQNASTAAQHNLSSRTITLFDSNCKRRQAATPYRNATTSSCDSLRLVLWACPKRRRKAKSLIVFQQRKMQISGGYTARSDTHTARRDTDWSLWRRWACCRASQRAAIRYHARGNAIALLARNARARLASFWSVFPASRTSRAVSQPTRTRGWHSHLEIARQLCLPEKRGSTETYSVQ